jgi:predicted ATP-grasp superfamily ATP-dependent carboligase
VEEGARRVYELHARPALDRPVMVMAPEGWIDAGLGGATAVGCLLSTIDTEVVATFDTDDLLDHRARRPMSHIVDGVYSDLVWPAIELRAGNDGQGHDVLVLSGPEPDHRWRAFAAALAELGGMFGVRMVVGLGAFPAPVPHTRPPTLAAAATDADLANRVGTVPGRVEVPAGVLSAVAASFVGIDVPTIGLWARVPHYAATMPYPPASVLLLEGLADVAGIVVENAELREAADATRRQLDELTANSPQHTALVRQLEAQADAEAESAAPGLGNLPTGDELAAELEKYLRGEAQ